MRQSTRDLKKIWILILLPLLSWGQARKYSNAFLEIGVDARSMALSNAVIASSADVHSVYWNPAGLANIQNSWEAGAMHAEYFASLAQYDYASYAQSIDDQSSFGVAFLRFGVDDILNTTELIDQDGNVDYDRITRFSAADYALIGSYARKSDRIAGLQYGGSFKIIYRQIGEFANALGFGFDAGVQYRRAGWSFGATLRDITTTFNSWSINEDAFGEIFTLTSNELPTENLELTLPRLLLGAGRSFQLNPKYRLHSEMSVDLTFGGAQNTLLSSDIFNADLNLGLELAYREFVFLRLGAGRWKRLTDFQGQESLSIQPNLGLGFQFKGIRLDYALTDIAGASGSLYSNVFSLSFNFSAFKGAS